MRPPIDRTTRPSHGLLLTPGAGASRDHHTLVAVEREVSPLPVRRVDFAYRTAGRRIPDKPAQAIATIRQESARFCAEAGVEPRQLILGGRSYGGRMCSMAVAEGLAAAGLVLLSYPLHPPGRSDRPRTEHFPALDLPVLFVSGTADPFGSPAEFDDALHTIPGAITVVRLPGGHDIRGRDQEVGQAVQQWLNRLA